MIDLDDEFFPWYAGMVTYDDEVTKPIDVGVDEPYDNFADLDMCAYCIGEGKIIPFAGPWTICPTCDGSGWVAQGARLNKEQAKAVGKA